MFQAAVETELPAVLWRLPNTQHIQVLVSKKTQNTLPPLEGPTKGFAFHPFQVSETSPVKFLPADIYFAAKPMKK
ncbi:hypothetical protein [Rufibacter sp. LB8]|uniref:hypothetical protein n=1 Tax=Rufibacter sp. LB8 TaxID=2777781 RepID=UPI00178C3809|nr:hypothetical protein [Rufibacter sp. LB8]